MRCFNTQLAAKQSVLVIGVCGMLTLAGFGYLPVNKHTLKTHYVEECRICK